jgi:hypothetical protein
MRCGRNKPDQQCLRREAISRLDNNQGFSHESDYRLRHHASFLFCFYGRCRAQKPKDKC